MTDIAIPANLTQVTPRWITDVLHASGALAPAANCVAIAPYRIGEGVGIMGELRSARLFYDDRTSGPPESVVVKMPSPFEDNREQAVNLGMYEAEVRFYREIAADIGTGLPRVHLAQIVSGTAEFVIVMEDLSHLQLVDQAVGMTVDQAGAAVRVLADIHAAKWGEVDGGELDWIPTTAGPRTQMVAEMMPQLAPLFLQHFGHRLPDGGAEHAEWFAANTLDIYRELTARTPRTLIHSDYRVENLLFGNPESDEVVVIDWQAMARGPGAYDLGYILSGSMQVDDRRAHERDLVSQYHQRLVAHGVDYDPEALWNDYCLAQTVGGIAVSVFAAATLDLANERGFELIATMANRHFKAALDLDARSHVS